MVRINDRFIITNVSIKIEMYKSRMTLGENSNLIRTCSDTALNKQEPSFAIGFL